jgi:SAM-dependent methyltransferase
LHWLYFLYISFIFVICSSIPGGLETATGAYWDDILQKRKALPHEDLWRANMLKVYADLFRRWNEAPAGARALKTDLYDEAVSDDHPMPLLLERHKSVFGIDLSHEVLSAASGRLSSRGFGKAVKAIVCDARHLPFKTGSFGFIFSNSSLDHFKEKGDLRASLADLVRVLEPRGILIATLDNPESPVVFLRNLLPYQSLRAAGLIPYYMGKTMSRRELVAYLASCGLQIQESAYIDHCPRFPLVWLGQRLSASKNRRLKDFLQKMAEGFERLSRSPLRSMTGYFVAVKAVKPPEA